MFIQTEPTPNPATMKFLPGRAVMTEGVAEFTDSEAAREASPLARRVFSCDGVSGVYLGGDFVSVTKADTVDWYILKPAVLGAVMEHFMSGDPAVTPGAALPEAAATEETDPVVRVIKELDR